jgi:hypothetical protein
MQFDLDCITGRTHPLNAGPSQRWPPQRDPTVIDGAGTMKLAHVDTIDS